MADQNINIRIKLIDDFTKATTNVVNGLQGVAKAGDNVGRQMRLVGREISQVGMTMTYLGGAITGPLLLAFKNMEKYSVPVHEQMNRLRDVTNQFQLTLATAMVPVMERITNLLAKMLDAWNKLGPATQQMIVQGALVSGVFLTLSGVLVALMGRIIASIGVVIRLGSQLMALATAHPVLLTIITALATIVILLQQMGVTTPQVLNAMELGLDMVLIGWKKVAIAIAEVGKWQAILWNNQKAMDFWASGIGDLQGQINEIERSMAKIMQTNEGNLSGAYNQVKRIVDLLKNAFASGKNIVIKPLVEQFDMMEQIAKGTAQAMTNSFGQIFFSAFTNQLRDLKQIFADFGRAILQVLSQAIARMILVKTIGSVFPSLGKFFHTGGMVRAHTGYLASDERQIVVQTGEGIISRRGMEALGERNLNSLNRGQGIAGGRGLTINNNPVLVIQAWDSQDVYRNAGTIKALIAEGLRLNDRSLRDSMKEYL